MRRRVRLPTLALATALFASPAAALTLLTEGKVGVFRSPAGGEAEAVIRIGRDRALASLPDPRCPTVSSLRFAFSRRGADFEDHGEIALPCEQWQATPKGMRFTSTAGAAGGVRDVTIGGRGVVIRAGGAGFAPITGPVAYVEAWLTIAGERHLVRLQNFRRNDATRVVSRRATRAGAAAEAAFWDTVWGDAPRSDEALRLLERAVKRDRKDGRSQFLLGMLHLYRTSSVCAEFDFANLCDAARAEGAAAQAPLDRAVELLPLDSRIPGFRAAATYANGFTQGDAALLATGLERIDAAVEANPLFNAFDLFAVVAPVTSGTTEYFQNRILPLVDYVFADASCLVDLPETCSNAGMAPHNFEGTLVLLGDIYAKGGRLATANAWYTVAQLSGASSAWRYQAIADDRLATAATRVALSQDADPTNDPPLLGGGGGSCRHCHNK
jgi:hypothetical protein